MDDQDCKKIEMIAKLTVIEYFDHYLIEVFPTQLKVAITAHNKDVTAHSEQIKVAVNAESSRLKMWMLGLIFAGGLGGGVGIAKAVALFAGG